MGQRSEVGVEDWRFDVGSTSADCWRVCCCWNDGWCCAHLFLVIALFVDQDSFFGIDSPAVRAESAVIAGDLDGLGDLDQLSKSARDDLVSWAAGFHDLDMLEALVGDGRVPAGSLLSLVGSRSSHGTERADGDVEVAEWLLARCADQCFEFGLWDQRIYGVADLATLASRHTPEIRVWHDGRCASESEAVVAARNGDVAALGSLIRMPPAERQGLIEEGIRFKQLATLEVLVDSESSVPADSFVTLTEPIGDFPLVGDEVVELADWLLGRGADPCFEMSRKRQGFLGGSDLPTLAGLLSPQLESWYEGRCPPTSAVAEFLLDGSSVGQLRRLGPFSEPERQNLVGYAIEFQSLERLRFLVGEGSVPSDSFLLVLAPTELGERWPDGFRSEALFADWLVDHGADPCVRLTADQQAQLSAPDVQTLAGRHSAELATWYRDRC